MFRLSNKTAVIFSSNKLIAFVIEFQFIYVLLLYFNLKQIKSDLINKCVRKYLYFYIKTFNPAITCILNSLSRSAIH